jgi:Ricin-type beta-trefoil lectin domain-like
VRIARMLVAVGMGLAGLVATLGLGVTAAHADPGTDPETYAPLASASSWLNMDVAGASTSAGAPVIQWTENLGDNQRWTWPNVSGTTDVIKNKHSGMCLTTDGVAGHQLVQQPCGGTWADYQAWTVHIYFVPSPWLDGYWVLGWFTNARSGLVIDVEGDSHTQGAHIIGWYGTGRLNQSWVLST